MAKRKKRRFPRGVDRDWREVLRGSSAETVAWLESMNLTRHQRGRLSLAVQLARRVALRQGEVIGTDQALERIAQTWLDDHPEQGVPGQHRGSEG